MDAKPIEILVVEDNQDDVVALRRAFKEAKILNQLTEVTRGEEALDFLHGRGAFAGAKAAAAPDLIILDLGLPDIGGLDVLRELRTEQRFEDVSVIVLTVSDQDEDIIRSYDLGVQAFIQKPVRLHNLNDFFLGDERFSFVITRSA